MNLYTGECASLAAGSAGGPGPFENPFVLHDPRRDRLWVAGRNEGLADPAVRMWALDVKTGSWQEQLVAHGEILPPGLHRAQLRDGQPVTVVHRVPETAAYGRVLAARLSSDEPHLKLEVRRDALGLPLNESTDASGPQEVVWAALPGETYRLVVSPAKGYPVGTSASFELAVEEGTVEAAGAYTTDWNVRNIAVRAKTAFLACKQGLEAVDFSDGCSPARISRRRFGKKGRAAAVMGRWVVFGRGPGLWGLKVIDARDPTQMETAGRVFTLGMTRDVALKGRTAYTAQGLFGVHVFDLGDPASPEHVDTLPVGGIALEVETHGSRLYVARTGRKVAVYDLVNGILELAGQIDTEQTPVAVRIHGTTMVVAELNPVNALKCAAGIKCRPADLVEVFDIADPLAPVKKADLSFQEAEILFADLSGRNALLRRAHGFRVLAPEVRP